MHQFERVKTRLWIFSFLLGLSLLLIINDNLYLDYSKSDIGGVNDKELKRADYWNLGSIYIDDDNPDSNWAITTATEDWCSGDGTENNPYIIENVTCSYQIEIENSDVHFMLKNCTAVNHIYLIDTNNGLITECEAYLELIRSDYNTISKHHGNIEIRDSSDYNDIANNVLNAHWIHIYGYSDYNNVMDNIINSSTTGMAIRIGGVSFGNSITRNNLTNNNYGINLQYGATESYVRYNRILNNTLYGIYVGAFQCVIEHNIFVGNTINAYDDYGSNSWNYNYWDDYNGVDANGDGIGDIFYDVPPVGGSVDPHPIIPTPNIKINLPISYNAFGLNAPVFNIKIESMFSVHNTWYTIDGGVNNYTFSGQIGTINQTAWDEKGTEPMILRFYANDSLGHLGFKDVTIWKDLIIPQITINSPTTNQLCGVVIPTFSLTIVEPNILMTLYSFNGRPNITSGLQAEWDNIGNGTALVTIYVIDKAGNVNFSEVMIRKDAYVPDVIIYLPVQDEIFKNTAPEFNISVVEEDLQSTWYTIEHIAGTFPLTELAGNIDQDAWTDAPEGEITITFHAVDRAGNLGTESVTVMKRTPSPPAIPGYSLFMLLGVLSVLMLIVSKTFRNFTHDSSR